MIEGLLIINVNTKITWLCFNCRLPDYYRHVVVFTPFAGSVWSLIILGLLVLLEFYEQKKSKVKHDFGIN